MKKSVIAFFVATVVGTGSLFIGNPFSTNVSASKLEDLKSKKEEISGKKSGVNSKIENADNQINDVKNKQASVETEIKEIDLSITDTESKIDEKKDQIQTTNNEIEKLKEEISALTERIDKRNELLKERLRSFQENGNMVNYLDVLVGSTSFSDFIDRISAIATIMEADKTILREQQEDKEQLEKNKAEVEDKLASLEKMRNELEEMKEELKSEKAEKNKLMKSLKKQQGELEELKLSLEEERKLLSAQEAAVKKAIELEHQKLKEQKQRQRQSINSGSRSGGKSVPVSSGHFTRPAAGYISSGFGSRSLGNHYGVDIASSGTVPVVAAADGVVIRSYYSSSYGNVIFITHSINGQIYTTVYAHLRERLVSEGAVVSKGQQIGIMGNTGRSYGQHLHFELHKGEWTVDKRNAINPIGIVPF